RQSRTREARGRIGRRLFFCFHYLRDGGFAFRPGFARLLRLAHAFVGPLSVDTDRDVAPRPVGGDLGDRLRRIIVAVAILVTVEEAWTPSPPVGEGRGGGWDRPGYGRW